MTRRQGAPHTLGLPEYTDLPYFAYGLFKPGELAHGQVDAFLDGVPVEAWVPGALYVRDGLPLLKLGGMDTVHGYLLRFREGEAEEAYTRISTFEPRKHYRWDTAKLGETNETANALLGRSPEKGSIRHEEGDWTGRRDPVLTRGLPVVHDVAAKQAQEEFHSAPPDRFDWPRLFRLQMAYLFLWTIIERYAALAYSPTLEPMEKVKKLGEDPAFQRALSQVVSREQRVYDSRDPTNYADLDPERGRCSAEYYYYVRSNLSHRGKGAWNDGEIVRRSLLELQEIVRQVLEERMGLRSPV
jgi:gamma-glutamylcyclotransferase (GGCT)/AIG2-like uncharacterized protein YtfP